MYYGGRGYHSVKELEDLVEHYKEASYQKQIQLQMLCERNLAMTKALEYIASDFCKDNQDYAEIAQEALNPRGSSSTVKRTLRLAIIGLEEAKRQTPWGLLFKGWQHFNCDCRICEALYAVRDLQKWAVEVPLGTEEKK